jgi:hypothetical protein
MTEKGTIAILKHGLKAEGEKVLAIDLPNVSPPRKSETTDCNARNLL